jgi:ferrous iron transport protein A
MNPIVIPLSRRRLSTTNEGEVVRVRSLSGGKSIHRRLRELGISEGTQLRVVQNVGGPVIVLVGDSRMGIGRGVADKIQVE